MSDAGDPAPLTPDVMPAENSEHERIPMQYLIIDAAQDPTYPHEQRYGGASVGCWIKNQTRKNAFLISKGWIEERGWVVLSLEEQYAVSAETCTDKAEARQYFEQACTDDEVFVFNTFPANERA